jgi:predicted CopG family antitoxin
MKVTSAETRSIHTSSQKEMSSIPSVSVYVIRPLRKNYFRDITLYVPMTSKTVSLSEEAYDRLKKWKVNDAESFSDVILRVLPKIRTPEELRKAFDEFESSLSDKEADKMIEDIEEN